MSSKATKRKYVEQEVLNDFTLPDDTHTVVKVGRSCGNNLHEVEAGNGDVFLVSMPGKYRRNIWIKRGDYVLVQPIEEGNKVKAEISAILLKDQIRYIQTRGLWPERFTDSTGDSKDSGPIGDDMLPPSESESGDDDEDDAEEVMFVNPNRRGPLVGQGHNDSDSSSDEERR